MIQERLIPSLMTQQAKEFYEGCNRHELLIQRCRDCGTYRHYPRPMCSQCNSMSAEWVRATGRGKVYTWTTTYHPFHSSLTREVPYIVAMVELDEGVHIMSNLINCEPDKVSIGMPVEAIFEDLTGDLTLPKFRSIEA